MPSEQAEPPGQEARPQLSVIIVARNCVEPLRRALAALGAAGAAQGWPEVVVVDLGSRDGSDSVDAEFPWIVPLRMPRNFGKTRARNIAVRTATGANLVFLDPRVAVEPQTIAALAAALDARPEAAAATGPVADPFRLPSPQILAAACLDGTPLPSLTSSFDSVEAASDLLLAVRRSFLAGMNYLDEKRYGDHWAELDLALQVRHAGKKIAWVPEARAALAPPFPSPQTTGARALLASARVAGAAAYIAKSAGAGAAFSFRLKMIFTALGRALAFRDAAFHFQLFLNLLSGSRVDGTQFGELA